VFVIHGINQGSSDVQTFATNLDSFVKASQANGNLQGRAFTFDPSFDYRSCAANPVVNNPSCSIENGADLLAAKVLPSCNAGNNIVIVAYSMGGLIARDMIANNRQNTAKLCKINALITLGTPNLGYPGTSLDMTLGPFANTANPYQMNEMTSDFRSQPPQQVLLSSYLSGLEKQWSKLTAKPNFWLAGSGSLCQQEIRTGDATNTFGCPSYNKSSDGVVCEQSSQYKSGGPIKPDQTLAWAFVAHAHSVIMCNPVPAQPVSFPASFAATDNQGMPAAVLYNPLPGGPEFLDVLSAVTAHCCSK
jgi:hypothetical protein